MTPALLIAAAWFTEAWIGWPKAVYQRVRHPVVWIGALINALDRGLNRETNSPTVRYVAGVLSACTVIALVTSLAVLVSRVLPNIWWGFAIEILIASSLIASRSLYQHVAAIRAPLLREDIAAARLAVSEIVGRDPTRLNSSAIARASLESLAENASDGVVAPVFWGAVFGLPGLAAYKAVNTLDSMIGHRDERHASFGGFAARLDDVANFLPARLTGVLIAIASFRRSAVAVMLRDARRHRSPNAGWPEAAMAGALGVRLSGPRTYAQEQQVEPWLNAGAPDPEPADLARGLALYTRAMMLGGLILVLVIAGLIHAT